MVTVVSTKPHHSVVKQTICRECGATLEYVPNDVQTHTYKDYGGGSSVDKYIICPNCGKKHIVESY